MKITRTSPLTGKTTTLDLPVTEEQLKTWHNGEKPIQEVMRHLSADEREFIMTGYTAADWEKMSWEEDDRDFEEINLDEIDEIDLARLDKLQKD